jgi:hypothetical protein
MLMVEDRDGALLTEADQLLLGRERPRDLFDDLPERATANDLKIADGDFRRRMRVVGDAGLARIFSAIVRSAAQHIARTGESESEDPLDDVGRSDHDPRRARDIVLDAIAFETDDRMRRLALVVARNIKSGVTPNIVDMLAEAAHVEADSSARKKAEKRQRAPRVKVVLALISRCVEAITARPYSIDAVKMAR